MFENLLNKQSNSYPSNTKKEYAEWIILLFCTMSYYNLLEYGLKSSIFIIRFQGEKISPLVLRNQIWVYIFK